MMRSSNLPLAFLALLALTLGACKGEADAPAKGPEKVVVGAESEATPAAAAPSPEMAANAECKVGVAVDGMVCAGGCTPVVMKALEGVEGVAHVSLDFDTKHADVLANADVCTEDGATQLVDALKANKYDGKIEKIEKI